MKRKERDVITPENIQSAKIVMDTLLERGDIERDSVRGIINLLNKGALETLPKDRVEGAIKVYEGMLEKPHLFREDVQMVLDQVNEEETEKRWSFIEKAQKAKTLVKKTSELLSSTAIVLSVAGAGFMGVRAVGDYTWNANYSPEAIARQAERNKWLEENAVLGLDWSVETPYNWKFRYLPADPNTQYEPLGIKDGVRAFKSGVSLNLPGLPGEKSAYGDLFATAKTFKKENGQIIPELKLTTKGSSGTITEVLLRDNKSADETIDTRVVQALDTNLNRERLFKIDVNPGDPDGIIITLMQKVKTPEELLNEQEQQSAQSSVTAVKEKTAADIKKEELIKWEEANTLGLKWSVVSSYNFRARYLPPDPNVDYEVAEVANGSKIFASASISLPAMPEDKSNYATDLLMTAYTHDRSDGKRVPKLKISTGSVDTSPEMVLRNPNESTPEIDARVIQVQDVKLGREAFIMLETVPDKKDTLKATLMRQVRKDQ